MKLSDCGLWIDLSLILNFKKPAADSYRRLKVDGDLVNTFSHDVPWHQWLLNNEGKPSDAIQSARDSLLGLLLVSGHKEKMSFRAGFDLAKLFEEAKGRVAIVSHESEDAMTLLVDAIGLKDAELFPLRSRHLAHETFAQWNRSEMEFVYVLERGVHLNAEQKIVQQLADKGVLINVKSTEDLNTTIRSVHHRITL